MPSVGIAEAMMGSEDTEELGGSDVVANAPADACGVVEHDSNGHATDELKYVLGHLAHALGAFAGKHLGQSDVGEREDEHEVARAAPHTHHAEVGLSGVRLRVARSPHQVQGALLADAELLLEFAGVVPDDRVGDLRTPPLDQTHSNALDRMTLLVPALGVLIQPGNDKRTVFVHYARHLMLYGRLRRETRFLELVHRVAKTSSVPLISGTLRPLMRICRIECTLNTTR